MKRFTTKSALKLLGFAVGVTLSIITAIPVSASSNMFGLSPMYQLITLTPGERYEGSFKLTNPADAEDDFHYELSLAPFSADNNNSISLVANGDYNQIVDWITLSREKGAIAPNVTEEIYFTINVPEDAPAGGQYASIVVASDAPSTSDSNINLQEVFQSAHLIYAEVAGETARKGKIDGVTVPGLMFSGNISGSATITNEGNVHSSATHALQVFPLFSNEEVFTNVEDPKVSWIMPSNTTYSSISWDNTPSVGIFHVIYKVSFEGVDHTVDKYVIICPLWLLLIICAFITLLFLRFFTHKRAGRAQA